MMILFNIRYQFYRFLVSRKNKRALRLEKRFVDKLTVLQRTYWYKVLAILAIEDLNAYSYLDTIVVQTSSVYLNIDLYSNAVVVYYTHNDGSSVHHTEVHYGENARYFFMHHYEGMLKKKYHKFMDERFKIIENSVKLEA